MKVVYMSKFNTGTTIRGIPMNTIFVAIMIAAPVILLLQAFIPVIPLIVLSVVAIWYVFIPVAEWLTNVIPPRYFHHLLDWLVQGGAMYVTNDSSPIPLALESRKNLEAEQRERERQRSRLAA